MKRAVLLAFVALTACNRQPAAEAPAKDAPKQAEAPKGPPPIPPYQMRAEQPAGNRLASGRDGKAVFEHQCGACHLAGGMGTNLLTVQRIKAGETPDKGMLTNRTDLTPDYVKAVVRSGKNAMPPQTKVDITDAELESVAAYLGKAK